MKLVFATNNKNKITEIMQLLNNSIELLSLEEINCKGEIPETSDTILGNALQKARYIYTNYGYNCFSDDTGLEIDALNGQPGVYSARYAGPNKSANDNIIKVLRELNKETKRTAQFITVIALIIDGEEYLFEGKVKGIITKKKVGDLGFGYDPIFRPEGYKSTFAQMTTQEKNKISHRGIATTKLIEHLLSLKHNQ